MKMNKIIDYKVIKRGNQVEMEEAINDYIKLGWQPLGGISFNKFQYREGVFMDKAFVQAIVKYENS